MSNSFYTTEALISVSEKKSNYKCNVLMHAPKGKKSLIFQSCPVGELILTPRPYV